MKRALTRPCGNCPFRVEGAIELHPGRLAGIQESLLENDRLTFHCHETTHGQSKRPAMCAGAAIWLLKRDRPNVMMRLLFIFERMSPEVWTTQGATVVD